MCCSALLAGGDQCRLVLGHLPGNPRVVAAWMAVVGAGMGIALATASSAALAELSEERSGVGSAVLQAVNKVGGPFGTAIGVVLTLLFLPRANAPTPTMQPRFDENEKRNETLIAQ